MLSQLSTTSWPADQQYLGWQHVPLLTTSNDGVDCVTDCNAVSRTTQTAQVLLHVSPDNMQYNTCMSSWLLLNWFNAHKWLGSVTWAALGIWSCGQWIGERARARAQVEGNKFVFMQAQCSSLFSCAHWKDVAKFRSRTPLSGVRKQSIPDAETLLAFGCALEAANLRAFKYLKT